MVGMITYNEIDKKNIKTPFDGRSLTKFYFVSVFNMKNLHYLTKIYVIHMHLNQSRPTPDYELISSHKGNEYI